MAILRENYYCPSDPMNWPISGTLESERLLAPAALTLDADATGIAITRVADEFTVLVVVTDEGELHKAGIPLEDHLNKSMTYSLFGFFVFFAVFS